MTAKELAKQLGISESAVSLALNNKPGVSTKTRNMVKEAAAKAGMDLATRHILQPESLGAIQLIFYRKHGAVLGETSFFSEVTEGVENCCSNEGYRVSLQNIYTPSELEYQLKEIALSSGIRGAIILGTEMTDEDFMVLAFSEKPLVLLDNHFISSKIDSIKINNIDGAYLATNYLIGKCKKRPGYLSSSYKIKNFDERKIGYTNALKHCGFPTSSAIIHELTPSIDGAFTDMLELIKNSEELAPCYFADNDLIAIGAMRAFKQCGYRIPEDISIIGFDDIPMCNYTDPPLTSIHVPKQYMGMIATERLLAIISAKTSYPLNIEVSPHLIKRNSVS